MNEIKSTSLDDTYNLIQLARETARAMGRSEQANRLTPVVDSMRQLVTEARTPNVSQTTVAAAPTQSAAPATGDDFRRLLAATQSAAASGSSSPAVITSLERNRLVESMAAANMPDLDIARQLGMTREEVRLVLSVNTQKKPVTGAAS